MLLYLPEDEFPFAVGPPELLAPGEGESITLEVDYGGESTGDLVVGLFPAWPPEGPPAAFQLIERPADWPVRVTLTGVVPGRYTALVMLDGADEEPQATVEVDVPSARAVPVLLGDAGLAPPRREVRTALTVTVRYTGPIRGKLVVAAFPSLPPKGPPAQFAIVHGADDFPRRVVLENVPGGSAQVFAYIDADPLALRAPGETDPSGQTDPVPLRGASVDVSVTLFDPA